LHRRRDESGTEHRGAVEKHPCHGRPSVCADLNQVTRLGNSQTFLYDANGNLTDDGVRTYGWDAEGRLVFIASKGAQNTLSGRPTPLPLPQRQPVPVPPGPPRTRARPLAQHPHTLSPPTPEKGVAGTGRFVRWSRIGNSRTQLEHPLGALKS
jgi:YD repeat-containing protein